MDEQKVLEEIDALIERKEKRIDHLRKEMGAAKVWEVAESQTVINMIEHGINTLIELKHALRLCGCPDEAYQGVVNGQYE